MAKKEDKQKGQDTGKGKKSADAKKSGGGNKKAKKGAEQKVEAPPKGYEPVLLKLHKEKVITQLTKRFDYQNPMEVPKLIKVVMNVGIGDAHNDQKLLESVVEEFRTVAGQQPVITRARKSISNFKLREGMQVGVAVTLRGFQMWEFLDKLFNLAIPRVRDFRGLPDRSFDGRGNYSFGIKEQIVFPEIDYDKVEKIHGIDVTFVTSANTDEEARELLSLLGCPFRKRTPVAETESAPA
ncbi:50S ribosomal protein L5 [bacterium]|nr:50S ribosomal protein L5 [bacterium]